ncbi:hypothetical protein T10_11708 [Trichinella papuae]|uniref:Uncharacterized protein n=1 Tax=Trichinella papuae TaxID=268474 RepID=A0A0V1MPI9_9BILA|nr:hypothetical protein T10_11708 [Trichinella papuae]
MEPHSHIGDWQRDTDWVLSVRVIPLLSPSLAVFLAALHLASAITAIDTQNIIVVECEDEARAIMCDQSEVEFHRRIYDLDVVAIISLESSLSCPKSQ